MHYFDLHCDTITECFIKNCGLYENDLHISIKKAQVFETWAQVFAVWMPDDMRGEAAWNRFCGAQAVLKREAALNGIALCGNTDDLADAVEAKNRNAALLSIEGSAALGGSLDNLEKAYNMGVRMITLTWNAACEAGGGCRDGSGLTPFGFELVSHMQKLGVVVDVSHLSDKGFCDVVRATDAPFVATHSNSRAVCDNKRNLTDDQFKEITQRGGIVGLNLCPAFLGSKSVENILKHADRFLSLGGENVIAVGADFDGAPMPTGISGIDDMVKIYDLLRENYGKELADKMFFGNTYKFFKTVLTGCNSCNNII
jgi:membrane dipeptidase